MSKLVINSVKINSANSQSLPQKEFSEGLNIICGANEAGKSTMMKFLKECFFGAKELAGDIELCDNGVKYQLKIDGKKSRKSDRVRLLSPENKSVEEFLSLINQDFYQKAFSINLDDIKNIDEDLFNIIQDHNANALSIYKEQLDTEIKQYLTEGGKPNKKLTDFVKSIAELDKEISSLAGKESEYAQITKEITENKEKIAEIKKQIENKTLIENSKNLQEELNIKQERITTIEKDFNQELFRTKQAFYDLNSKSGLITNYLEELKEILNSKCDVQIQEAIELIKRDYNMPVSAENLGEIDISKEFETKFRNLKEELTHKELQISTTKETQEKLSKTLSQCSNEFEKLKSTIEDLGITDYNLFKEGLNELQAAITSISESGEIYTAKAGVAKNLLYLLISIALVAIGIYLHNSIGILIDIAGLAIAATSLPAFFRSKKAATVNIYDFVKTDVLPKLNRNDKFLQTVPALNAIFASESTKLNKYELIKSEYDKKNEEIAELEAEFQNLTQKAEQEDLKHKELINEIKLLTTAFNQTLSPENYIEFLEKVRSIAELVSKTKAQKQRGEFLENEISDHIENISKFLTNANLDGAVNRDALAEKSSEIISIINENDRLKHELDTLQNDIKLLNEKLSPHKVEDLAPFATLEELVETNNTLLNESGRLEVTKKSLEEFEGLIIKRNERNIKQNRLKEIIKNLYSKKLALNIIEEAEKQQRALEPNLVSAETLLNQITGGKYVGANFAARAITSANGEMKTEDELSRGTREQVYLAFRLGYAQNYGADEKNSRLPLIIDDAFVNFDKERLTNILTALKEFAKTNQVLFFTCHKEYITGIVGKDANIVDID